MKRARLAILILMAAIAGCGGEGKRVSPASPNSWCYGCDGATVYAPGASFLVMTTWDATCEGGAMRAADQIHPCDAVSHQDSLTCTRDGGGGACKVVVRDDDELIATPTQPGTYLIAVTMEPRGGTPYHRELGRVVVDMPDRYAITCTAPKVEKDLVIARIAMMRGETQVLGPTPTVTIGGKACDAMPAPLPGGDETFAESHDFWCHGVPAGTVELAIASPTMTRTERVDCAAETE